MTTKRKAPRRFQIVLTGTIPKGMTLAQARHAYWNGGFNGDGPGYNTVDVDVDDYFDDARSRRPMKIRLGRASMVKG
jgi:hypothetical protein